MRELTPVRLTERGTLLVLVDASGTEYVVATDARLRDTLGRAADGAAASPVPSTAPTSSKAPGAPGAPRATSSPRREVIEMDLRPREIQARIRAGESAADLAAVAGAPEEKVMAFAGPVLAERAHVADTALAASLRRQHGEPAGESIRTLGDAADSRLRAEGADREALTWDAWRREDGRWTVEGRYRVDGEQQRARFTFDLRGRFVTADDEEGRWLIGDGVFPSREEKEQARRLRLAPEPEVVPDLSGEETSHDDDLDQPFDIESDDAAADFGAAVGPVGSSSEPVDELAAAVRDTRIPRQASRATPPTPAVADADPVLDVGLEALMSQPAGPMERADSADSADSAEGVDREDTAALARRHPRKQRGRASVPTWDEIMFGGAD